MGLAKRIEKTHAYEMRGHPLFIWGNYSIHRWKGVSRLKSEVQGTNIHRIPKRDGYLSIELYVPKEIVVSFTCENAPLNIPQRLQIPDLFRG